MDGTYQVLTGPTAAGKTGLLAELAANRDILAISADSRQVFRYMNIGTGKPDFPTTGILPHRLISIIDPADNYSVHQFVPAAVAELRAAAEAGHEPWIIGGTGLYIRAVTAGLTLGAAPRSILRQRLELALRQTTSAELCRMLELELDEQDNPVRLIRAAEAECRTMQSGIELYDKLGLSAEDFELDSADDRNTAYNSALEELTRWNCRGIAVLDPGVDQLLLNISDRVQEMFGQGLVAETEELRRLGFGKAGVVTNGIGYWEAGLVLDGEMTEADAIESTVIRTRQYAKRQRTYFRGMGWEFIEADQLVGWAAKRTG